MLQIYKASAGSGKTFRLTREYIKYLIAVKQNDGTYRLRRHFHKNHSHILAITFTNKATNEMTRRIIKELAVLADMVAEDERNPDVPPGIATTMSSSHAKFFTDELKCTPGELRDAARQALTNLLYDYSLFNVSTIDSFFQSVLRIFSREVDLPDNYAVELNNGYALTLGVEELFNTLDYHTIADTPEDIEKRWIHDWLVEFMHNKMSDGAAFNMFSRSSTLFNDLVKAFGKIMNEDFKRWLPELRPYFTDLHRIKRFAAGLNDIIDRRREGLQLAADSFFPSYPTGTCTSLFEKAVYKFISELPDKTGTTLPKVADDGKAGFTKTGISRSKLGEDDFATAAQLANEVLDFYRLQIDFKIIRRNIYTFGLLSFIMKAIDSYSRENNLVLLSETNNILKEIINDDETPFLYEKLGYYLDHFLIDEFQDTSPMQWDNMRPLMMESLSRDNDDLVIGDEKQCIYRFRNSDPMLLGRTVEKDAIGRFSREDMVDIQGIKLEDNCNWRSAPEIVRFNNSLFMALAEIVDERSGTPGKSLSASATYRNIVQMIDPHRNAPEGYVNIQFYNTEEAPDEGTAATDAETPARKTPQEEALEFMTLHLRRQLAAGYRPGEIAVLVRSHKHGELVIKHLLSTMNSADDPLPRFDIISSDALSLSSCRSVNLIISVLRLVSLPQFMEVDKKAAALVKNTEPPETTDSDYYRRARLINRYQFYLHMHHGDGEGGALFTPAEALEAAIRDNSNPDTTQDDETDFHDEMKSLLDMKCLNLPAVVERIIDRFVPEASRKTDNLFLTTFQDIVIEYSDGGKHDIRSFLNWWDNIGRHRSIVSPADSNALTVITIHQAKGLEYPCVHIPFADGTLFKDGDYSWFEINKTKFTERGLSEDDIPPALPMTLSSRMSTSPMFSQGYADITSRMRVDELNVFYVAFTRATRELIVHTAPKYKTNEGFMDYLTEAILKVNRDYVISQEENVREWLEPLDPHLNGTNLVIGAPTVPLLRETEKQRPVERIEIESYRTSTVNERAKANTRTDALEPFDINKSNHLGNFLHSVMSLVTDPSKLDYAFNRQAYRFHIPDRLAPQLRSRLEEAIADPRAYRWFNGFTRVITERSISSRGDFRRPDRIVWLPDGCVEVVDYKFVHELPENLEANPQHNKYIKQVDYYCTVIKGSTHSPVSGYIWYIAPGGNLPVKVV